MKIERKKERSAEVYTASLNDIMFFLLLFFLIIATMATPAALQVAVPKSGTAESVATKKNLTIVVTADRQYLIEERPVQFDQLESTLASIIASDQEAEYTVLLQADKSLAYQHIVDVLDIVNRQKVKALLVTEKHK